jgi:putative salt-induced outer membrane protein
MRVIPLTFAALALPLALAAQAAAPTPRRAQLTLDLGFIHASGNSNVTSFNLGEKLTWRLAPWVFTQTAKALYGTTEGTTTTESYEAGARAEYRITPRFGAFALLSYQRDPFAGVAVRWGAGPGLAYTVVQAPRDTLSVDAALTAQRERSTANVKQSFTAARTGLLFRHRFGAAAVFSQALEWIANLETMDDQRLNAETALTAPLSRQIALRVSYLIRFDNLPEPGFEGTDRILTTGVQIAF